MAKTKEKASTRPPALVLPEKPSKTAQYLYDAGFFGEGEAADYRLGRALNLTSILKAVAPDARNANAQVAVDGKILQGDAAILAHLLEASGKGNTPEAAKLKALFAKEPDVGHAVEHTQKINRPLSRMLRFVTRGRFGGKDIDDATEGWSEVVAVQSARRAIDAFVEAMASPFDDRKTMYLQMAGLAEGSPANGHGNHLGSALYLLGHPEIMADTVRQHHKDLAAMAGDAKAQGKGPDFGEVVARAGLLLETDGEPLKYREARAVADLVLMEKTADRIRLLAESIAVPVISAGDTPQTLAKKLHDIAESIAMHTPPLTKALPNHANGQIHADQGEIFQTLNLQRDARKVFAIQAHALADGLHQLAGTLEQAQEDKDGTLRDQAIIASHLLGAFKQAGTQLALQSTLLAEAAMRNALARGDDDLREDTNLPKIQAALSAAIDAKGYPADLLKHRGNGEALMEEVRQFPATLKKAGSDAMQHADQQIAKSREMLPPVAVEENVQAAHQHGNGQKPQDGALTETLHVPAPEVEKTT